MFPLLYLTYSVLRARLDHARADERGAVSTEMVVITALLVALGIAAVAIIAATVLRKAESINLDGGTG